MESVSVDYERRVHAPVETTRRTLLSALERGGFTLSHSTGGDIEARRGSHFRSLAGAHPLRAEITVVGHGNSSRVLVHLADAAATTTSAATYWPSFLEVQGELDGWLLALDPAVQTDALPPPQARVAAPTDVWLQIVSPAGEVFLTPDEVQMIFAVAGMVMATPGGLPPGPVAQLEEVVLDIRRALDRSQPPCARLEVDEATRPAIDFLHQQMTLRQMLPVRHLTRCRECRFERVTNPDYDRIIKRNRRLKDVLGLVGVSVTSGGANVFVVAGKLLNLKQLDPEYVCQRCQGMKADVTLVTICPQCGAICKEPALRRCSTKECGFDYRTLLRGRESPWETPRPVVQQPLAPPPPGQQATTAPPPPPPAQQAIPAPPPPPAQQAIPAPPPPPPADAVAPSLPDPGWYPDPSGRHGLRWFEEDWTEWVSDGGVPVDDPL